MKKILMGAALISMVVSCGGSTSSVEAGGLRGSVSIDGSSTVLPITEAVAEDYRDVQPDVSPEIGTSGTGGGFKKFIAGETDISNASRYIKPDELKACEAGGREFIEIPVAYDGLAVVVNKANDFAQTMTVAELSAIWSVDSVATKWSDVREGWPEREFKLYSPGPDSGTFDYFTETVNGKSGNCRPDATFSEDDNVLVIGVAGDVDGIGFFGLAYYVENEDKLNSVAIDGGNGTPVKPTYETIENGTYTPLSRPLLIYVSTESAKRPEVEDFVTYYINNAARLSGEVGYVPFPQRIYDGIMERFNSRVVGTEGGKQGTLEDLYL